MHVFSKLLLAFAFVAAPAFAADVHGILRVVKGDVQIKSAKSGQNARARIGEKVFPKDVIVTGKDARAKIVMVDNNEINVSPESQIEIQNYEFDPAAGKKDVLLNVIYGKVRSKVEQKYDGKTSKFQIKTPSAVAGVRGTDFLTSYAPSTNTSQIVTFEGRVEFGVPGPNGSIANPVFVAPGQQASNSGSTAPSAPAPVPKEELVKMDKDSKNESPKMDANQPSADQRTPAADEKKKDDGAAPKGNAPASGGGSTSNGGGSAASDGGDAGSSSGGRSVASTGGGKVAAPAPPVAPKETTIKSNDLPSHAPLPPPIITAPSAPMLPDNRVNNPINNCDYCRENLTGQTKLLIKVNAQ